MRVKYLETNVPIDWRLVAQLQKFLVRVLGAFLAFICSASPLVLTSPGPLEYSDTYDGCGTNKQAETIPKPVARVLLLNKNVAANGSAKVTEGDEQGHSHSALPGWRKIISAPCKNTYERWVYTRRNREK